LQQTAARRRDRTVCLSPVVSTTGSVLATGQVVFAGAAAAERRYVGRTGMALPSFHPNLDDAALDRVLRGLDASLMNDTKWVRLLDGLNAPPELVFQCAAKLVWQQEPSAFRISGATFGLNYYQHAVEGLISGPSTGWHRYKEIEWLEFPRFATIARDPDNLKLGTQTIEQDLRNIRARINAVGSFELRDEPSGLRLYAYLRL
jgi:hypothetical protein